jgi:hypothetical protein
VELSLEKLANNIKKARLPTDMDQGDTHCAY